MKSHRFTTIFALAIVLVCASCAKEPRPDGMPDTFPCEIKLIQDGQPLEGAFIHCQSDSPELIRWAVTGQTDASGVAKIFTMGKYAGAPAGSFAVVVTKEETEGGAEQQSSDVGDMAATHSNAPVFSLVPLEMTAKETTPFQMTVETSGPNKFEFDCGEKVRVERPKEAM